MAIWKEVINTGDVKSVQKFIASGADVNASVDGEPLLIKAVWKSRDIVRMLINAGADVNAKNGNEETALIKAAGKKYPDIVKLLINAGADVNVTDNLGKTALDYAQEWGNDEIVTLLEKI